MLPLAPQIKDIQKHSKTQRKELIKDSALKSSQNAQEEMTRCPESGRHGEGISGGKSAKRESKEGRVKRMSKKGRRVKKWVRRRGRRGASERQ